MLVLHEGRVAAGDPIVKTASGPGGVTVADADALLYLPGKDLAKARAAVGIPALSPGWRGSFEEMLAGTDTGAAGGAGAVEPDKPGWTGFRPLRVTSMVRESGTVTSIELATDDGTPLPAARAGQYLTLRVPAAGGPVPVRSYSLSSAPGARRYRISVKREPHGAASGYLTTRLRPGTVLDAAAPRGDFILDDGRTPVLLISAGIGVTPVLSMLHQLAAARSSRPVWWIHGTRGPAEHPLAAEAHALLAGLPNAREHVFFSSVDPSFPGRVTVGRITGDRLARLRLPSDASAYVCGPAAFMDDMRTALTGLGLQAGRIHTEVFGALGAINPGVTGQRPRKPHQPPGPAGTGPQVTFARSGLTARFPGPGAGAAPGSGPSVLEFAESCDVPTRYACRSGVCHTCVTPLVSGEVRYSPDPLEPPASGQALVCCARPETDIVVDM
jgi:ferredoxin-NADP reductase